MERGQPTAAILSLVRNFSLTMKPKNPTILAHLCRGFQAAGLAALLTVPFSAFAQDAEPARVIVTGSYIPTAESEGPLPVSVYTAAQLQRAGANTPAEGLRQLPSYIGATATENDSNGGTGAAFVNLRALGAGNTLTLINGRRAFGFADINAIGIGAINRAEILKDGAGAVYGSDAVAGVVNFIMLDGPGADKFNGVEIDLLYGNTTNKDAGVKQAYLNAGFTTSDGKLSMAVSANYYDRQAIYSRDRHLAQQADARFLGGRNGQSDSFTGRVDLGASSGLPSTDPVFGASAPPRNRIIINPAGLINGIASTRVYNTVIGDGFNFRAFTPSIPGQEKFAYYGAFNYKLFGDNRVQFYGDALYSNTRQDNGIAPAPFTLGRAGDAINTSPWNPFAGTQLTRVRYRLVAESGNRRSGYDHKFYRFETGLKGDFQLKGNPVLGSFTYDLGAVYEEDKTIRTDNGDAQRSVLLAQALPPGTARSVFEASIANQGLDPTSADGRRIVDRAVALNAQFGGTFNPFIGANTVRVGTAPTFINGVATGASRAYNNLDAVNRALYSANTTNINKQYLVDARFGGILFPNLPQGGIAFSIGAEYRSERTSDFADPVQRSGDQLGFNAGADDSYRRSVYSAFGELSIPIVTPAMKVPFVQAFDVTAAGRYERFDVYSGNTLAGLPSAFDADGNAIAFYPNESLKATFNNGFTPRFTFRYQPFSDLTLRGSYGKSFLAPTYQQLFAPPAQNFPNIFDPVTGRTTQPPGGVFQGGNPQLRPEKSDTFTLGLVYTPSFFKGFTITVDYYQINTKDVIVGPAGQAQIFTSANGFSNGVLFANIVDRGGDPNAFPVAIGTPNQPITSLNAGKRLVEGIDTVVNYELPTANFGKFTWTLGWNHFFRWKAQARPDLGFINFRGSDLLAYPLAPGSIPNNKGFFRTDWEWRNFDFVATINYIEGYHNDGSFLSNPANFPTFRNLVVGGTAVNPLFTVGRNSREYITLDLQASYEFKKPKPAEAGFSKDSKGVRTQVAAAAVGGSFLQRMLWGTKIKVGINNVFDTPPPFDAGSFNDNYDTSTYSIRNRYYYIGINKKF